MDDTIITIYCLCDDFLKATGHRDDPQVRLSTAEVMTIPLVACAFFCGNIDTSRLNRRIHAIEPKLWRVLFELLVQAFKERNANQTDVVDSLPVAR